MPVAPKLFVLTGPTAVGKTELALRWAEQYGGEIVSCDSLLFYRGMDIGTAKPTPAEQARVPHHLIDIHAVDEPMNIQAFVVHARAAVDDILGRGRRVLVTGGSGFYLKAFFAPIADEVTISQDLRVELEERLAREGLESLVEELRAVNPDGLGGLDVANPRRVIRALERCRVTGRTVLELREEMRARPSAFADLAVECVRLERPRPELWSRIDQRIAQMLDAGLVAEVERLLEAGIQRNPSASRAIGYRETILMLRGELSADDLPSAIARNTRALVRKQETWFRTQLPPHRVVPADEARVEALFET